MSPSWFRTHHRSAVVCALLITPSMLLHGQPESAVTSEFANQKVARLATTQADYLCEKLYDSAEPLSMALELASIFGWRYALVKLGDFTGFKESDNAKYFADLRQLARTKIWLSPALETELGDWLHSKYASDGEVLDSSTLNKRDQARLKEAQATLDKLVATLPANNPYKFKLHVMRGTHVNASAGLGGHLYVTQGLLRDNRLSPNDIALRLGHELAHQTRRHALKDIQLKIVDLMELRKDFSPVTNMAALTGNPLGSIQKLLATAKSVELLFQRFEQNQELESDACGIGLVHRAPGYNALDALAAYVQARPAATDPQDWDTSHPKHEEREYVMRMQLDDDLRARHLKAKGAESSTTSVAPAKAPEAKGGSLFEQLRSKLLPSSGAASAPTSDTNRGNP